MCQLQEMWACPNNYEMKVMNKLWTIYHLNHRSLRALTNPDKTQKQHQMPGRNLTTMPESEEITVNY